MIYAKIPIHLPANKQPEQIYLAGNNLYVKCKTKLYMFELEYVPKMNKVYRDLDMGAYPFTILSDGDTFLSFQKADWAKHPNMNDMEDAKMNMIIGSLSDPMKNNNIAIGFREKIRKVVVGKREYQAFLLLENKPYIYRVFIKQLMD